MTSRIRVTETGQLDPGDRQIVSANGRSIGVFNVEGEYYALENDCAHQHGPVCTGKIQAELVGEFKSSGELVDERFSDTPTIACPWHGWEYNLETGAHLGDQDVSLPTFDVVVEDGTIFVEIPDE